jgi:hypothetical protein
MEEGRKLKVYEVCVRGDVVKVTADSFSIDAMNTLTFGRNGGVVAMFFEGNYAYLREVHD